MLPDGKTVDRRALHASCPTVKGVKWTSTLWIRSRPYGGGAYDPVARAGRCEDLDPKCGAWAGEAPVSRCDADPAAMLGLGGRCRRACRDCAVCAADDLLCLRANGRSRRAELLAWDAEQERRRATKEPGGEQPGRRRRR
jgi:prolyl 4-hydroxylase